MKMINVKNLENEKILKCGYIGVIGRPNVGKSSLINNILKKSVTITSKKRQTTRDCILGVLTQDNSQFIFVDTPGIESSGKHERNRILNSLATATLNDVDLILWVVEAKKITIEDKLIFNLLANKNPIIVAINKVDLVTSSSEKKMMFEQVKFFLGIEPVAIVPISVLKSFQIKDLLKEIKSFLPKQDKLFDHNYLTNKSLVFRASETIREKIFRLVGDELPYSASVIIESCSKKDVNNVVEIYASIVVSKKSHKPIIIGKNATRIKKIKLDSSRSLDKIFDANVDLTLWVKVR